MDLKRAALISTGAVKHARETNMKPLCVAVPDSAEILVLLKK